MRPVMITFAASIALVSTGCGRDPAASERSATNDIVTSNAIEPSVPVDAPLASADFANAVAGNGRFETESAALAASTATSPAIKELAAMISSDHQKAGADLKAAAAASSPSFSPLASLNAKQKSDLAALKGSSGAEFDRLYVSQQIAAHKEAVSVLTNYAAAGASPQLKGFASKVLPTVQTHSAKLEALPK